MKPFNLERALAGDKLITRNGLEVTEFHYLKSVDITEHKDRDCIVFVAGGELHTVTLDGKSVDERYDHPWDLFMAPIKKTYWVNIYKKDNDSFYTLTNMLMKSESNARAGLNPYATIPIEIEE